MTQSYVMDLRQDVQLDAAAQQAGINPGNQGNIWYFSYWTNNHQSNNRPPTSTDIISTIMKYRISIFNFCNLFISQLEIGGQHLPLKRLKCNASQSVLL